LPYLFVERRNPILGNDVSRKGLPQSVGVGGQRIIDFVQVSVGVDLLAEVSIPVGLRRDEVSLKDLLALSKSFVRGEPESFIVPIVQFADIHRTTRRATKLVPNQLGRRIAILPLAGS